MHSSPRLPPRHLGVQHLAARGELHVPRTPVLRVGEAIDNAFTTLAISFLGLLVALPRTVHTIPAADFGAGRRR